MGKWFLVGLRYVQIVGAYHHILKKEIINEGGVKEEEIVDEKDNEAEIDDEEDANLTIP